MSFSDPDQPLGDQFLQNPYEYLQSFVRNMNNEIFLSEYQLNHLYALLLLKKQSPWDTLKPNSQNLKTEVEDMVNKKVAEVKKMLENLSQVYEDKLKKNTFTQIQRLMSILKAKNKSIFIEKDMQHYHQSFGSPQSQLLKRFIEQKSTQGEGSPIFQIKKQKRIQTNQNENQNSGRENDFSMQIQNLESTQNMKEKVECISKQKVGILEEYHSSIQDQNQNQQREHKKSSQYSQEPSHLANMMASQNQGDQRQVLSLFYGIANIPNLSTLALGNCLQNSTAQRYIKFKMSKNYIMTIKNEDEVSYDRTSTLRSVSSDLFIHRIFPYLTAVELFKVRGVCKEWMQNVKQAWHSTFKRQMFVQLMACEFCKQIELYYKLIQLRNPFFQKLSLLMHALIEIIQWDKVYQSINNNTIVPQLKKVLIILLKLLGQNIIVPNLTSISEQMWQQNKQKMLSLKQRVSHFLNNIESSGHSNVDLIKIKTQLLDDPFMRVEELNSEDKTPMLLVIFIKQLTLQQILKNHIFFSQEYLMNTKRKLDNISSKMPPQKGFLEGVYKVILLRSFGARGEDKAEDQEQRSEMPNFASILTSIFDGNEDMGKPDFVLKSKSSLTNIYMDKATKLDIIVSTVRKMNAFQLRNTNSEDKIQVQQMQNKHDQCMSHEQEYKRYQNEEVSQNTNNNELQKVEIYSIKQGQQQSKKEEKSNIQKNNNKTLNFQPSIKDESAGIQMKMTDRESEQITKIYETFY